MPPSRFRLLYVSDLTYQAKGRRYCDEDIFLSSRLREGFDVAVCHPVDAARLMESFDMVMVRNSGPVVHYQTAYDEFRERALESGVRVYNELRGKADMAGKQYLLDLSAAAYPVIPTTDGSQRLSDLPQAEEYVVKPIRGSDSIGLRVVAQAQLAEVPCDGGVLVQPRIDFAYEVSFYFVDCDFQYALYAPADRRWALQPYHPDPEDLRFAQRFIDWNDIIHGIQRVDACRTTDGDLLLVELEDLNPYLSLEQLHPVARDAFVARVERSLHSLQAATTP